MGAPDLEDRADRHAQRPPPGLEGLDSGREAGQPGAPRRIAADLFASVQLEYPGVLGLADGRYLARDRMRDDEPGSGDDVGRAGANESPDRVLVVRTLGAPRRHLIRGRRTRQAAAEPAPAPLPLTRVTVISSGAFESRGEARRWLERTTGDEQALEAEVDLAVALLNRALHVQRAGAADPLVGEVGERDAAAIRVGYGSGDDLVEGRFAEAREVPGRPPRRRRAVMLRPQERIAAVLGGRQAVAACETLVLRARLDLDNGRTREAALQIRVGLEALIAELGEGRAGAGQADDMAELDAARGGIGRAANAALTGELDAGQVLDVTEAIEVSERVLRRRRLLSD